MPKDEYLMLRDEILHLSTLENNTLNFFYIFVSSIMAFSFTQEDTIFIGLSYLVIIPAHAIIVTQYQGIYKIGAYLFVFHEGKDFNWERRSWKFYEQLSGESENWRSNLQSFNFPFIFASIFVTAVFMFRFNWEYFFVNTRDGLYETAKMILMICLFAITIWRVIKYRHLDNGNYLDSWEKVKADEKLTPNATIEGNNEEYTCNLEYKKTATIFPISEKEYEKLVNRLESFDTMRNNLLTFSFTSVLAVFGVALAMDMTAINAWICLIPFFLILPFTARISYYRLASAHITSFLKVFAEDRMQFEIGADTVKENKTKLYRLVSWLVDHEMVLLSIATSCVFYIKFLYSVNSWNVIHYVCLTIPIVLTILVFIISHSTYDYDRIVKSFNSEWKQ